MSMRFLVVLSVSGFHFGSKFGRPDIHFLYIRLFARRFFSQHELHFYFHDRNIFCSRLTSAISPHAQVQFHAKYPLFDRQPIRLRVYLQLCDSIGNTPTDQKKLGSHSNSLFFSPHPSDSKVLEIFSSKNNKLAHKLELTYLYAYRIMLTGHYQQISKWNAKGGPKNL